MQRLQLIEIEDQPWCPPVLRDAATDYLQLLIFLARPYHAILPRLHAALQRTRARCILDLASGAGGPWRQLQPALERRGAAIPVRLSDKYPNLAAFRRIELASGGRVDYLPEPLDAGSVPPDLPGFRTIFSSFHHFPPREARAILRDAVRCRRGIGIFEATRRDAWVMLLACLNPFLVLLLTPFLRPFRWSRLLWTYLVPAVPLLVLFDGLVSCLRTYTPAELAELARQTGTDDYLWQVGLRRAWPSPLPVTYLIGTPRNGGE